MVQYCFDKKKPTVLQVSTQYCPDLGSLHRPQVKMSLVEVTFPLKIKQMQEYSSLIVLHSNS